MLQCVLQCVLQRVAVCRGMLQCVQLSCKRLRSVLQSVVVYVAVCVAVCVTALCTVLQCIKASGERQRVCTICEAS